MSIYEKPVRLLMKDFVRDQQIVKDQVFTRELMTSWFRSKYPKIKLGTISAHLLKMSINAPSRVHYAANPNGEDDLLYQIDSSHFRLYEPERDPQPIYLSLSSKKEIEADTTIDENKDASEDQITGFAYESDLRDFLSKNLHIIELGLHLYEEEGITGVEFPVGGRFIDILALDRDKNFVVIELKVSRGYDRVIGQLLRYMAWIEKHQAEANQKVRGVIIAREITDDLRLAASRIADVKLFEYDLSVTLKPVSI